jgi:putative flippase GtrA
MGYLPLRVRGIVSRELVGYTIISMATFGLDLLLLATFRHRFHMPVPLAVSVAYMVGFAANYVLNRALNFHSHAPVGGQVLRYCVVAVADFVQIIGVTSGLVMLGCDLRLARMVSGTCLGLVTYVAYRKWVFRR